MNKNLRNNFCIRSYSLVEVSIVILVIGILIGGVVLGSSLVKKSLLAAAQTLTNSSPVNGIKDSALWLETAVDSSFVEGETSNNSSISVWYDARKNAANKISINAAGTGPVYSNTINYVHAVKFSGSSSNYLQISDASFLNNTDYTIIIVEKRQSNSADNYFFGESPAGTANQKLALGYSLNGTVIHAQGTNSYTSNVSSYETSTDKPKVFTFISDSSAGKKTYINGVLAAQSSDTAQLSGITTNFPIGKSYNGEIGEIAIFTRALKAEERKSLEDYLGKKFTVKINRDSVPGGSCTNGMITPGGCSMDCSTSSRVGISTPSTIADGQTVSATCGQSGYNGTTVSLTCSGGNISGTACGCALGYNQVGSACIQQCSVNVNGSNVTSVSSGVTQVACNAGGNYSTTPFTFSACVGSPISGSCSCNTGYSGSTCNGCDTSNGYQPFGGICYKACAVPAGSGTTLAYVQSGTTSTSCNGTNYTGTMQYTCNNSGTLSITTPCQSTAPVGGTTSCYQMDNGSGATVTITAPAGKVFNAVVYADFGTGYNSGACTSVGSCNSSGAVGQVQAKCIGKSSCTLSYFPDFRNHLGDPCGGVVKRAQVKLHYQ